MKILNIFEIWKFCENFQFLFLILEFWNFLKILKFYEILWKLKFLKILKSYENFDYRLLRSSFSRF
jgi:hypothetical protein